MKPSARRVRAADVAAAAGVSATAVSFVMNGRATGNISAETRGRVLRAARELGYEPDYLASSLRRQRTNSIGLVTDCVASGPFGRRMLAAATERAAEAGHASLIVDLNGQDQRAAGAIRSLERRRVDAVVYVTMGLRDITLPVTSLPLVLANCTAANARLSVIPDDAGGARVALQHLAELGHRRVAALTGSWDPETGLGNVSGPIRAEAFVGAATAAGVDATVLEAGWDIDDGYRAASGVLDAPAARRPTALFAVTDRVALGATLAAARLGLAIPSDVSIVGFDDQASLAAHVVPPLTTVALPHAAIGAQAMELALGAVAGTVLEPEHRILDCPLVVRGSTGAAG